MKTITALALLLATTASADVVVHDNRDANFGLLGCFDSFFSQGRLNPFLSPEENQAIDQCYLPADQVPGSLYAISFARATSCSIGLSTLSVTAGANQSIFAIGSPFMIEACPEKGGFGDTAMILTPHAFDEGDAVGDNGTPANGVTYSVDAVLAEPIALPQFIGFRLESPTGELVDGWLEFAPFPDNPNSKYLVGWAYSNSSSSPAYAVAIDNIQRTPDYNLDGSVDSSDLANLLAHWGTEGNVVTTSPNGAAYIDLDDDGTTNASDLAILLAAWGTSK